MGKHKSKYNKKGTILLLITSIGFLLAIFWLMQTQVKPKNIGEVEFTILKIGNEAENNMFYIDKAAEYSLQSALEIKSRSYKSGEKTYTNKEVCNLQLDACKEGKSDCKTNLKLFCEDEVLKGFKEKFGKYLDILNKKTNNKLDASDYEFEVTAKESEITTKIREIEITGKATKSLQSKEGEFESNIKLNFRAKASLR